MENQVSKIMGVAKNSFLDLAFQGCRDLTVPPSSPHLWSYLISSFDEELSLPLHSELLSDCPVFSECAFFFFIKNIETKNDFHLLQNKNVLFLCDSPTGSIILEDLSLSQRCF